MRCGSILGSVSDSVKIFSFATLVWAKKALYIGIPYAVFCKITAVAINTISNNQISSAEVASALTAGLVVGCIGELAFHKCSQKEDGLSKLQKALNEPLCEVIKTFEEKLIFAEKILMDMSQICKERGNSVEYKHIEQAIQESKYLRKEFNLLDASTGT